MCKRTYKPLSPASHHGESALRGVDDSLPDPNLPAADGTSLPCININMRQRGLSSPLLPSPPRACTAHQITTGMLYDASYTDFAALN